MPAFHVRVCRTATDTGTTIIHAATLAEAMERAKVVEPSDIDWEGDSYREEIKASHGWPVDVDEDDGGGGSP